MTEQTPPLTNDTAGFAHAREAWMEQYRPFGPKRKSPPRASIGESSMSPNPAHYDPRHATRFLPLIDDGNGNMVRATPASDAARLEAELKEAFARETYSLADLTPARIRVTYRVMLSMAHALRIVRVGDSLSEATEIKTYDSAGKLVDPWTQRRTLPAAIPISTIVRDRDSDDLDIADVRHVGVLSTLRERHPYQEISLTPPPVPRRWLLKDENGNLTKELHPDYDPSNPKHDLDLVVYCAAFRGIYSALGIERGAFRDPHYGINGMVCMDDAATIRHAFPSRGELLAFEGILIHDTLKMLIQGGTVHVIEELQAEYGFTIKEAKWVIKMAQTTSRELVESDVEMQRNLSVLRVEDLIRRCRDSLDKKTELRAQHELNNILGITRSEPTDVKTSIAQLVREWDSTKSEAFARAPVPMHIELAPPAAKFGSETE